MDNDKCVSSLETAAGYSFKDKELAFMALCHSSYAHERKINKLECNERLEFLGDAVLELISSRYIYERYPKLPEGKLTALRAGLVCEKALHECAEQIGLGELLLLGKGEEACGGRKKPSVCSDAFEALIGAIYLDGGMEEAEAFVKRFVLADTDAHLSEKDAKTRLQEYLQARGEAPAEYRLLSESGPDHAKSFLVEVAYLGQRATGVGKNKKSAEKEAAAEALRSIYGNTTKEA